MVHTRVIPFACIVPGGRVPCRATSSNAGPQIRAGQARRARPPRDAPPKSLATRRKGSVTTVATAEPMERRMSASVRMVRLLL
ncbi:MAG TPA: hypothetical protein DD420_30215 [Streptomyces sp.]|nr:hypothetical protein [Streptomyces sp.]